MGGATLVLAKIEARSTTVYIDACFSGNSAGGQLIRNVSGISVTPRRLPDTGAMTVLTAARGSQVASWDAQSKHGLFTRYLLEALGGAADKGDYGNGDHKVTLSEVEGYLKEEVMYQARRVYNRDQNVTVSGAPKVVLASLTPATAAPPPRPAPPTVAVEEMDLEMVALKSANVREGPSTSRQKLTSLPRGNKVTVTGKAGKWYRVALAGGKVGFVFATLLGEEQPQAAALSKASAPQVAVGVFEKTYRSGDTFKDCPKCPQMVVVPEGSFRMGDLSGGGNKNEKPVHSVRIPRPFAVGVYEVTFAEWDACVGAGRCGGYRPNDFGWGRGNRPVINVSWDDAQAYVSWLSRKTGEEYRLLSEAEWEYAARAGSANQYHFGSSESDLCRYGNGGDRTTASMLRTTSNKSCSDGFSWTAPVGSFAANAFGLHDAHGNVDEWVEDCWRDSYAGAPTDGSKWTSGGDCARSVRRGGSWADRPGTLRSASRRWGSVGDRNGSIFGFRIARTLD